MEREVITAEELLACLRKQGISDMAEAIRQEVVRLAGERMTKATIASQLNIGEATVYRILAGASKQK